MAATSAAAAATFQQTPITFQSRPSSSHTKPTSNISLSSSLLPPTLSLKPSPRLPIRRTSGPRGGSSAATMAESAAGSYANALVEVAVANNTLEKTTSELETLEKFFSDDSMVGFFTNPIISVDKKREVVDEIAKSSSLQPHVANFLNILVDMKRIDMFKEIAKEFELVINRLTETETAVVTSVVELEPQHLAQIAKEVQKLTNAKNVRIKTKIDPSLVAGFTIRYGSTGSSLIDMSVKTQLEEIASQLDLGDIQLAV